MSYCYPNMCIKIAPVYVPQLYPYYNFKKKAKFNVAMTNPWGVLWITNFSLMNFVALLSKSTQKCILFSKVKVYPFLRTSHMSHIHVTRSEKRIHFYMCNNSTYRNHIDHTPVCQVSAVAKP